jgi:hypothetical protein
MAVLALRPETSQMSVFELVTRVAVGGCVFESLSWVAETARDLDMAVL